MIEFLESAALAAQITDAQTQTVTGLRERGVIPTLAILEGMGQTALSEVGTYVGQKIRYMQRVGMHTRYSCVPADELPDKIEDFNADPEVHGIIVELQIPFADLSDGPEHNAERRQRTEQILDRLHPAKSVDSQGSRTLHGLAVTAVAGVGLLDSYGYTGEDECVLVAGSEGVVGGNVCRIYENRRAELLRVDWHNRHEMSRLAKEAGIIVLATGHAGLFKPDMVRNGHRIVGIGARDIDPAVYDITGRDFSVTPPKGGVGPLTVREISNRVIEQAIVQAGITEPVAV